MKKKLFAAFLIAGMSFAVFNGFGCSLQGEGERCDSQNGDLDCQTGLTCVSSKDLGGSADICCPPAGSTNPECLKTGDTTTSTATSTVTSTGTGTTTSTTDTTTSGTTTSSTTTSTGSAAGGAGGAGGATSSSTTTTTTTASTSTN